MDERPTPMLRRIARLFALTVVIGGLFAIGFSIVLPPLLHGIFPADTGSTPAPATPTRDPFAASGAPVRYWQPAVTPTIPVPRPRPSRAVTSVPDAVPPAVAPAPRPLPAPVTRRPQSTPAPIISFPLHLPAPLPHPRPTLPRPTLPIHLPLPTPSLPRPTISVPLPRPTISVPLPRPTISVPPVTISPLPLPSVSATVPPIGLGLTLP